MSEGPATVIARRRLPPAVLLIAAALVLTACSSDSGPSTPSRISTAAPASDVTALISQNHLHIAVLTAAQITAAVAVTLDIQGSAVHTHTISLTALQVADIGRGAQIAVLSTLSSLGDFHQHLVTFN